MQLEMQSGKGDEKRTEKGKCRAASWSLETKELEWQSQTMCYVDLGTKESERDLKGKQDAHRRVLSSFSFGRCRSRTPALAVGAAVVIVVDSSPELSNAYTRESQADGGAGAAGAAGATEAVGAYPNIQIIWQSSVHSSKDSDGSLAVPLAEQSKGQNVRHQHEQP